MFDKIDKVFDKFTEYFDYVARLLCVAVCLLTAANAIGNKVFSSPIYGTYEYAQLMTVVILSGSLAYCGLKGGHVYVTFLTDFFTKRFERALIVLWDIIMIVISSFMGYYSILRAASAFRTHDAMGTVYVAKGPFYIIIAIGFIILALTYIMRGIRIIRHRDENTNEVTDLYQKEALSATTSLEDKGGAE